MERRLPDGRCPNSIDFSFIANGSSATLHFSTTTAGGSGLSADPRQHIDDVCVVDDLVYQAFYLTLRTFDRREECDGNFRDECADWLPTKAFASENASSLITLPFLEKFDTDPIGRGWDLSHGAYWDVGLGLGGPTDSEASTSCTVHGLTAGRKYHLTFWWDVAYSGGGPDPATNLTVSVTGAGGPNLVTNGSFETNLGGWNGYARATLARVGGGQDGSFAVQVTGPTPGVDDFGLNDSPSWITDAGPAGTHYEISAYVRSASSTSPVKMRIREYKNRVRVGSRVYSATQALTTEWQRISMEYVTRATGTSLDFQILNTGHVAGDVFLIDNVVIRSIGTGASAAMAFQNPTPSSTLVTGGNCVVQWSAPATPVDSTVVSATTDGGVTWSVIGTVQGGNLLNWSLPGTPSSEVALLVESFANGVVVGDAVSDFLNVRASALAVDDGTALPMGVYLATPQPTPFESRTTLAYGLPRAAHVRIQVFDVNGRLVNTLVDGIAAPGNKTVVWSGTNDRHAPVGAGVYLIRLTAGDAVKVQRAVRLR